MSYFSYKLKLHTMRLWLSSFVVVVVAFTFSKSHSENEVVTKKRRKVSSFHQFWKVSEINLIMTQRQLKDRGTYQISTMMEKEYTTIFDLTSPCIH